MSEVIDYAVSYNTDFHQFMLYTPNPGTPLYEEHKKAGTLYSEAEFPVADAHGQYRFNYRHQHIKDGREEQFLLDAFNADFKVNGPSLFRLIRTHLSGWQKYKHHPDKRIRDRYDWEVDPLRTTYAGAVWAMKKYYRRDKHMARRMDALLRDIYAEFGWKTRLAGPVIGAFAFLSIKREEKRLARGWTYEPACHFEKNEAARAVDKRKTVDAKTQRAVLEPFASPAPVLNEP
jgi:hypothetical protein